MTQDNIVSFEHIKLMKQIAENQEVIMDFLLEIKDLLAFVEESTDELLERTEEVKTIRRDHAVLYNLMNLTMDGALPFLEKDSANLNLKPGNDTKTKAFQPELVLHTSNE